MIENFSLPFFFFTFQLLEHKNFQALLTISIILLIGLTLVIAVLRKNSEMADKIITAMLNFAGMIIAFYFASAITNGE